MKKIMVSKNSGYCMGVKNAFMQSYKIAEKYSDICIYGEMVHNKFALESLYKKGIIIKSDLKDIINNEKIKNVIIRAHGIPPEEEEILNKSKKNIFDLTCPKVKNVQLLAQSLSNNGYKIIIYGKNNHPEVIGIRGYCKNNNFVIKDLSEIEKLPFDIKDKIALISQTTMNSDSFNKIAEALKIKYINLEIHNTLCSLPIKTQNEAIELSKNVDLMIVVGDKMSANTNTLYEKIKNYTLALFAETKMDIKTGDLKKFEKIGITGGSSTPDWQIEEIKNYIESLF